MRLDEGMDTGDMLSRAALPILADDTAGSLTTRLAELGADLLADTLPRWVRAEIAPQPQDNTLATMCKPIHKESGRMDWNQPAAALARAVRAYAPWPGTFTYWNGRLVKIISARAVSRQSDAPPGTVVNTSDGPAVVTADGLLLLLITQLEGKRALPTAEFVRGQRDFVGAQLG